MAFFPWLLVGLVTLAEYLHLLQTDDNSMIPLWGTEVFWLGLSIGALIMVWQSVAEPEYEDDDGLTLSAKRAYKRARRGRRR